MSGSVSADAQTATQTLSIYKTTKALIPVDSELLLLIRRPGRVLLICWELGFVEQDIHQLEIHRPVDLKVHGPLLHLK